MAVEGSPGNGHAERGGQVNGRGVARHGGELLPGDESAPLARQAQFAAPVGLVVGTHIRQVSLASRSTPGRGTALSAAA